MSENAKKVITIVGSTFGVIFLLFLVFYFFTTVRKTNLDLNYTHEFNEGWEINYNGNVYYDQTLSNFNFPASMKRGDTVTIRNTLPLDIDKYSTFRILNYLTTVEAFVDGELVYSYGTDIQEENGFVGSGYHFIALPVDSAGKDIYIVFKPNETAAFTNIPEPIICATDYVFSEFFDSNVLTIFISVFLFVLGVAMTLIALVAQMRDWSYARLVPIGVFSFLIGLWTMCSIKLFEMFSVNLTFNTELEYISLYYAIVPVVVLILMMNNDEKVWHKVVLWIDIIVLLLFGTASTAVHFLGILHLPATVTTFHILAVCSVITVLAVGIRNPQKMAKDEIIVNIGLIVLLMFGLLDVLRFNIQKYMLPENENLTNSVLPVGTMTFIILLLISYLVYIYTIAMDKTEKETLTKMAYQDPMTGLYNRAKCDEMFNAFDNKRDAECTLILCDLNGLKKANDTWGHEAGDLLISLFSQILRVSFENNGTIMRMGGDEFLIMINHKKNISHLKACLLKMIRLEREVSKKHPFPIECSYGIAFSTEVQEHKADKVYMLADERMYQMKMKSKNKRED